VICVLQTDQMGTSFQLTTCDNHKVTVRMTQPVRILSQVFGNFGHLHSGGLVVGCWTCDHEVVFLTPGSNRVLGWVTVCRQLSHLGT